MSFIEEERLETSYVMHTYGRKPLELVRGQGMSVFDDEGAEYLDFIAGVGSVSLGHCHPAVVDAIASQAARLIHVSNYYYIEQRGEVAKMLSNLLNQRVANTAAAPSLAPNSGPITTPISATPATQATQATPATQPTQTTPAALSTQFTPAPWQSFFANSGAEANECAIKLARLWGKKHNNGVGTIVTLKQSFHGRTLATLAATAQPAKQEVFQPLPAGFTYTPLNDIAALEELFAQQGDEICAIMVECIQGESGVHPCTAEFLQAAYTLAHAHGALVICDEIQCGMFRCGTYPFGFQHFDILPDIVTIAKGVASGFPTGMCAAREDIAAAFEPGDHGSTFGGSCLAVAAAKATIETLATGGLAKNVEITGKYLCEKLQTLPHVVDVRGYGLMCACDFDEKVDAAKIVSDGLGCGLLLNNTGPHTLRFLPPLTCGKADVDVLVEKLLHLLSF